MHGNISMKKGWHCGDLSPEMQFRDSRLLSLPQMLYGISPLSALQSLSFGSDVFEVVSWLTALNEAHTEMLC